MPDDITGLEQELIESQILELKILANDGRSPMQGIINSYAGTASLYSDPVRLQAMIDQLKIALNRYIIDAKITGRIMGKKAINKFLEESEIRDRTQKALANISRLNENRAAQRTKMAFMELEQKTGILKSDIVLFKQNAKIAGFNNKEILSQLVMEGKDKTGVAQAFAKKSKQVAVDAVRRERSAAEIEEYRKVVRANELWQWINISSGKSLCQDCSARGGRIMGIDRWERMGFPGSGRTICERACICRLIPYAIAAERFPNTKAFTFDTKNLVLTTASEERSLRAKSNKPKG